MKYNAWTDENTVRVSVPELGVTVSLYRTEPSGDTNVNITTNTLAYLDGLRVYVDGDER